MTTLRDWLFADDLDGHEWLVHRASPRFIARIVDDQAGERFDPSGLTVSLDDHHVLAEFQWLDKPPPEGALRRA